MLVPSRTELAAAQISCCDFPRRRGIFRNGVGNHTPLRNPQRRFKFQPAVIYLAVSTNDRTPLRFRLRTGRERSIARTFARLPESTPSGGQMHSRPVRKFARKTAHPDYKWSRHTQAIEEAKAASLDPILA